MASTMFLYWGSGSPPCWRAMLALEEKGFGGYPNKLLSFSNKEHKGEEVMKLNPRGQLPTFKHGDLVINESLAIIDYVESTFPDQGTKLIPDDTAKRALVLQRKYEAEVLYKKGIENYFYTMRKDPEDRKQDDVDAKLKALQDELAIWEGILTNLGGDSYLTGPDFTVADIMFIPTVAFFARLGIKLEKWPRLNAYLEKVKQRPSVQASWPPHWKDSPNMTAMENV